MLKNIAFFLFIFLFFRKWYIIASEGEVKIERRIDKNLFLAMMIEVFTSTERSNYVTKSQ